VTCPEMKLAPTFPWGLLVLPNHTQPSRGLDRWLVLLTDRKANDFNW
jgi:hypothetical protein